MLSFLAAVSLPQLAAAQTQAPRASLVVTRGEGAQDCPDAALLAEQVRSVTGSNVLGGGLATAGVETWVQVAIVRNFGGLSAQISTSGARHGNRTLEDVGPSCVSLADAIAITIAIILDPYSNAPPPAPLASAAASPRLPEPAAKPVPLARPAARYFAAGSGGVALDLLQHTQPLLAAEIGIYPGPRWALGIGGAFVFADTKASTGGEVELSLRYGYLLGCGRTLGGDEGARLDWCVSAQLGSLQGRGRGYAQAFTQRSTWIAIAVGPKIMLPFTGALSWVVSADGLVPLTRNAFDVQNKAVVSRAFQSSAVAAQLSLGVRGEL